MRILIVNDAAEPYTNGVAVTFNTIAGGLLRQDGHIVRQIVPRSMKSWLPFPPAPLKAEFDMAFPKPREMENRIKAFDPDAIHIATEGPLGRDAAAFCRRNGLLYTTSYCTHWHHYIEKRAPLFKRALSGLVRRNIVSFHNRAARVLVATESLGRELTQMGVSVPTHVISRPVDTDLFKPGEKTLFRDKPGPLCLYVGRVSEEKGIDDFLRLKGPGTKIVVGDGPARERLESLYPEAVFTGVQKGENLAAHFRAADLFVFPSKTDTYGRVLREAQACGVPAIAYPVGGAPDILGGDDFRGVMDENLQAAFDRAKRFLGSLNERQKGILKDHLREVAIRESGVQATVAKFVAGQIRIQAP